jgi:2',3'-cyclic-nucleotide 2'-phosphodiesterase / 3'-nucleotidase
MVVKFTMWTKATDSVPTASPVSLSLEWRASQLPKRELMKIRSLFLLSPLALLGAGCFLSEPAHRTNEGLQLQLTLLESTDVHSNVLGFDYYKLTDDPSLGFERTATLIRQARKEFTNTLLFDDGDTIQGTALADLQARAQPLACDRELAMYKAMDVLGYDGGTIGNHEFNYGLKFLSQVTGTPFRVDGVATQHCAGPHFPLVLANIISLQDQQPLFPPYSIIERRFKVWKGTQALDVKLRIGIIGFTPPPVMQWDYANLNGRVQALGVVEAAQRYLPELNARGADLIVVLSHGGIDAAAYSQTMENANWHLSKIPGIDAILLGHSHDVFPDPANPKSRFANIPGVDNQRGLINGVPAVMGNFWGKSLGLITLNMEFREGHWRVDRDHANSQVRSIQNADGSYVAPDAEIARVVHDEHIAAVAWMNKPIGESDFRITSYFAEAGDVTAVAMINSAQRDFVERYIRDRLPEYRDIPVLSAASAFKTGFGGATDFTDIPAGPLAAHHAADLYVYPNTIAAVKIDGAGVKAWLEHAAKRYNRIDPASREAQPLINPKFPSYNLDIVQGDIDYHIDITQPRQADRSRPDFYRRHE